MPGSGFTQQVNFFGSQVQMVEQMGEAVEYDAAPEPDVMARYLSLKERTTHW